MDECARVFLRRVTETVTCRGVAHRATMLEPVSVGAVARVTTEPQNEARSRKRTIDGEDVPGLVSKLGPSAACKILGNAVTRGWSPTAWRESARLDAILGSAPKSRQEAMSGLKCWQAFADGALQANGKHLPPSVNGLLAWSTVFRNHGTFTNYLGKLRLGCEILGVSTDNLYHPTLKRAIAAIKKRAPPQRPPLFLRAEMVLRLMAVCAEEGDQASGLFYLATYAFLLRPRDEALPIIVGANEEAEAELEPRCHSCLSFVGNELVLRLASRKNKPHGSVLRRGCWCKKEGVSRALCPVHTLGMAIARQAGSVPFADLNGNKASAELRRRLAKLGVANAGSYRLHDFRRGHARNLQARGASLWEILQAGEWRSCAFLDYLDKNQLEADLAVQAHIDESDEE